MARKKASTRLKKTSAKKKTTTATKSKRQTQKKVAKKTKQKTSRRNTTATRTSKKKVVKPDTLVGYDRLGDKSDQPHALSQSKIRKIKSGLARKDFNRYRQMLRAKRDELFHNVEALGNDARNDNGEVINFEHLADAGSDNFEQEFTLGLMDSEQALLQRIDQALLRMKNGTYGVCVECGAPIGRSRLDAKPWAKWCIKTAEEKERRGEQ